MRRQAAVVAIAALAVLPLFAGGLAVAQADNSTATPTDEPTPTPTQTATPTAAPTPAGSTGGNAAGGEYDISELRRDGRQPAEAPSSVRYLMDNGNPTGAVAIRYQPAAPLQSEFQFLKPDTTLHTDDIQLYSTRFGSGVAPSEYTLHVVFWQAETREVTNGTQTRTERIASKQTERTYSFRMGTGYATSNITLPNHFDATWRTTMWLSSGGNRLDGVRWTMQHQTVASAQDTGVEDRGELWLWAGQNIFLIAIPGLLGSGLGVRGIIKRTGRGPDKGAMWWGMVTILGLFGIISVAFFETARMASRLPQVFGALIVAVGFVTMLEMMGREPRTDEFVRDELQDAKSPMGAALKNVVYGEKRRVTTVRRDDGQLGLIKSGIRPFLARLWADPARLDDGQLKTDKEWKVGPDDHTFIADPEAEQPLVWTPAHWEFDPTLLEPKTDETSEGIQGLAERVNFTLISVTLLGSLLGFFVGGWLFTVSMIPAVAGAAAAFVATSTRARDGHAEFEPAPMHYRDARASLAALQVEYADAKSLDEARNIAWKERAKTAQEAKQISEQRDSTVSREILSEELGVDPGGIAESDNDPNPDSDGGLGDDADSPNERDSPPLGRVDWGDEEEDADE